MEQSFSIDEILMAVNEIQNKKKEKKTETKRNKPAQIDYSVVPKNTLKLIEEAEKIKN
ncbi:hypothetical protein N8827_02900 [Pelagibacteraceae bacterium]|nr:hypothetical protein [Pelagibacteraceae bacterium]